MSKFPKPASGSGYKKNPLQQQDKHQRKARRAAERRRMAQGLVPRGDSLFWHQCAMYAPELLYTVTRVFCGSLLVRCVLSIFF